MAGAKPHIGIICVKDHEYEEFTRLAKDKLVDRGHSDEPLPGSDFFLSEKGVMLTVFDGHRNNFRLSIATFGKIQGPVAAAARTVEFALRAEASGKPLTHMGMVGICGGRKLGSVIVAEQAWDAQGGRNVNLSELKHSQQKEKDSPEPEAAEAIRGHDGGDFKLQQEKGKADQFWERPQNMPSPETKLARKKYAFDVKFGGCMHTYPHVNDDLYGLTEEQGLEMEAFAMFHSLKVLSGSRHVQPLPVIKGVSDVDWRDRREDIRSPYTDHNLGELKTIVKDADKLLAKGDTKELRAKYRHVAAKNAATVMCDYVFLAFQNG